MIKHITTTPAKALEKLKAGNARYIDAKVNSEDISQAKRTDTLVNGQKPYAIIITCCNSGEYFYDRYRRAVCYPYCR